MILAKSLNAIGLQPKRKDLRVDEIGDAVKIYLSQGAKELRIYPRNDVIFSKKESNYFPDEELYVLFVRA